MSSPAPLGSPVALMGGWWGRAWFVGGCWGPFLPAWEPGLAAHCASNHLQACQAGAQAGVDNLPTIMHFASLAHPPPADAVAH